MDYKELIRLALTARDKSYCAYSGYAVGASLLTKSNKIYTGCNIENAAYGPSCCAERTAIFKAVSEGEKDFLAIAITGGKKGLAPTEYAYPCGVCRQVMREFCEDDFEIIVANSISDYQITSLGELLPHSFGSDNL